MTLKMYSVRDAKADVFNTPFFNQTHGEAERNFKKLVNDPKSTVNQFPDDFDLYYLGEYNDNKGTTDSLDSPQHITKAVQVLDQQPTAAEPGGY